MSGLSANFNVICLTETWLTLSNFNLFGIDGYNHVGNCRPDRVGGGTSIFIKEYVPYYQRVDLEVNKECIESTFVEISSEQGVGLQGVIVGSVYRPPNTNIEVFNSHMSDILVIIKRERKAAYITGDFNINLLNADSHIPSSEFLELMYSNLFLPIINRPTRVTHSTATIIDHIYCNNIKD